VTTAKFIYNSPLLCPQQQGYAIQSSGSSLEIRDTCFLENNFIGYGTVRVYDKGLFNVSGVYGDPDAELTCNFLAYSDIEPQNALEVTCTAYDAKTCKAANVDIPTRNPAAAVPTPAPSVTPTANNGAPSTTGGATKAASSASMRATLSLMAMCCAAVLLVIC
jgi:hypothetical protein